MPCTNDDLGKKCDNCTCEYKTVAVIPCLGRFPLVEVNVKRLYQVNGVTKVVLIGNEPQIKRIAEKTNSIFVEHKNNPLGKKWNAGFVAAKNLNPDAVLFVGSSDLISKNWLPTASKYLKEYDLIGRLGCHLLDINTQTGKRLCYWPGYGHGVRAEEPIGIGRVISARVLDKIDWKPFNEHKDNSMDWFMYDAVLKNAGKVKIMDEEVHSMAISTNMWENKHSFIEHWTNKLPSEKINGDHLNEFLNKHFPESINLFK